MSLSFITKIFYDNVVGLSRIFSASKLFCRQGLARGVWSVPRGHIPLFHRFFSDCDIYGPPKPGLCFCCGTMTVSRSLRCLPSDYKHKSRCKGTYHVIKFGPRQKNSLDTLGPSAAAVIPRQSGHISCQGINNQSRKICKGFYWERKNGRWTWQWPSTWPANTNVLIIYFYKCWVKRLTKFHDLLL